MRDYLIKSGEFVLTMTTWAGDRGFEPEEIVVDGERLVNDGLVYSARTGEYKTSSFIFRQPSSKEVMLAEESVKKAESALQAAKGVLNKLRGK